MMNTLRNFLCKYYKKFEEIVNYLIAGVLTTIVSLCVYYLSVLTFLNPYNATELQIANILSWICAVTFAYFINKKFVFKSNTNKKLNEATNFYTSRIMTLLLDMATMFILVTTLHVNDKISKLIVQVIVTITNYALSKLFVFKKL